MAVEFSSLQEAVKKTMENSKAFPENIRKCCCLTLQSLAYAGTGDVLKVFPLYYFQMQLEVITRSR